MWYTHSVDRLTSPRGLKKGKNVDKNKKIEKSIELRGGQIIYGNHYTKNNTVYCENGLSVDVRLVVRKNGKKTFWA